MARVTIRPGTPEEAGVLTDIAQRAKAHWGYSRELLDLWSDDLTIRPEDCDGESLWVMESDGTIIGFGEIRFTGDSALLDDLWIDPNHIGSGYGRQLFVFLRDLAARRGATRLTLEAEPFAVGFYQHMGARIIGEIASEAVPGRTLPVMELHLTPPENTTINPE